jgi:alkylation response protein AidB-like acyl-CoA dehydrogenase
LDFDWTDEQLELRAEAVAFARKTLDGDVETDDRDGRHPREKWDKLAAWGFFGLSVPESLGGGGLDCMSSLLVTEGLGVGCSDRGLLFSAAVQAWVIVPVLLRFATEDQRRRYLPGLMDGSVVGALAVTEPESGSDAFAMKTSAERVEGGWRLQGSKLYITNGPIADLIVCFARTGTGGSLGGVSAFLVEADWPGVKRGGPLRAQGLRTAPLGELAFHGVHVPDEAIFGRPGFGLAIFNEAMEWERSYGTAVYLGMLERQLEEACAYARERRAFGGPIASFQSVAGKLVDMRLRLETARLLLYRACWLKAQGKPVLAESAMAKLWLSECAVASSLDAIQVHGAYGYMAESGVERGLRDAVGTRIHSGTSELQEVIIARSMGL